MKRPYWYRILLVLRAAVTEEILFLGLSHREVSAALRKRCVGCNRAAAFTYAHLRGWGPVQLIAVRSSGVVLALLYVWRRDLPSNMLGSLSGRCRRVSHVKHQNVATLQIADRTYSGRFAVACSQTPSVLASTLIIEFLSWHSSSANSAAWHRPTSRSVCTKWRTLRLRF
jgi:hypothetical protein